MTRPLAIIAEELEDEAEAWLAERCEIVRAKPPSPGFSHALPRADALIVRTYTRVDADLLSQAARLRVVARAGVGVDNIDLASCAARGVTVVHTPDANTRAVVEFVLAVLLDELRPRATLLHAPDAKEWASLRRTLIAERGLSELTLGIWGMGRIGSQVARAAAALDMRVLYHDLLDLPRDPRHAASPVSRDDLLASSDIVSIHVDGRRANRGLVGESALACCRDDVVLINTSRGFVVDPPALAAFLSRNRRARALLDVHEPEPIDPASPLLGLPNARLSPHLASGTAQAKRAMSWVVRDVWRVLQGQPPEFPASPEME